MSKLPVSKSRFSQESPPAKRRKVFNDITGTMNKSPLSQHQLNTNKSHIPVPKPDLLSIRNSKKASAPVPTRSHSNLDKAMYSRLKNLCETDPTAKDSSLNLKKFNEFYERSNGLNNEKNKDKFKKDLLRSKELDAQIEELKKKIEHQKQYNKEIIENSNNLKLAKNDIEVDLNRVNLQIDQLKFSNDKFLVHLKNLKTTELKDEQNQLLKQLDEFKSMLIKELDNANNFDNTELKSKIADLKQEKMSLTKKLNELNDSMILKLEAKQQEFEERFSNLLNSKENKIDELSNLNSKLKENSTQIELKISKINDDLNELMKKNCKLENEINFQNEIISSNGCSIKDLNKEISLLRFQESEINEKLNSKLDELNTVNKNFNDSNIKIEKERNLRRRLQNSIEEINGKLRVYINLLNDDVEVFEHRKLKFNSINYEFDKVFYNKDNFKFNEFTILAENVFKNSNVSFINCGNLNNSLDLIKSVHNTLMNRENKYSNFKYTYNLQIVDTKTSTDQLGDGEVEISFDNNSSEISSTSILLNEFQYDVKINDLTLLKITINNNTSIHILNVSSVDVLEKYFTSNNEKSSMLKFIYESTKTVTIFNIDNDYQMLNIAKRINSKSAK